MNNTRYDLHTTDCINADQLLDPDSIDLIVTSPPYNVGIEYGGSVDDSKPYDEYIQWLMDRIDVFYKVLVPGGRMCLNVNDPGRNPYMPIHADLMVKMRDAGWFLMGLITWNKMNNMNNTAWGSWESASAPGLRSQTEFIIVAAKPGEDQPPHKKAPRIAGAKSGPYLNYQYPDKSAFPQLTTDLWDMTPESSANKHPAPFPYELASRCIRLYSFEGDHVLDPFAGSGTTLRASLDFRRYPIGFEIEPEWQKLICQRLAQENMF